MALFRRKPETIVSKESPTPGQVIEQGVGVIALHGSQEGFIARMDALGTHLDSFSEAWDRANAILTDYLADPDRQQVFADAVHEYNTHRHQDSSKPKARRITIADETDFVAALAMRARRGIVRGARDMVRGALEVDEQIGDVHLGIQAAREIKTQSSNVEGKWRAVRGTACDHMSAAVSFYRSLDDLQSELAPLYKKAWKSNSKILSEVEKYLDGDHAHALEVTETIKALIGTEDSRSQRLLSLLATDFDHMGEVSLIGRAIRLVTESGNSDVLVPNFLNSMAMEKEGSNWIEFTRKMFESMHKGRGSFLDYMLAQRGEWPTELEEGYRSFTQEFAATLQTRMKRELTPYVDPQLLMPSMYDIESAMDRLMRKVAGEPSQKAAPNPLEKTKAISPLTFLPHQGRVGEGVTKRQLEATVVVTNGDTSDFGQPQKLDELIMQIAVQRPGDTSYEGDLRKMVAALVQDPFIKGTTPLVDVKEVRIGPNAKKQRVYRLNPSHATGLLVGQAAKDARITYIVADKKVGILGIFPNHDAYERWIKNNKG